MIIRKITNDINDIEGLVEIDKSAFGDIKESFDELLDTIDSDNYHVFLAMDAEEYMGYIATMKVKTLHYDAMWIDLIAVKAEHRNKGVATELVQYVIEKSRHENLDFISALARNNNLGSIKALEKFGFKHDGEEFMLLIREA